MEKAKETTNCPYCLSPIDENAEVVRCPVCGVVHHAECWRANGKCSVYGCDGWQAWSGEIADKIAPKIQTEIDIHDTTTKSPAATAALPRCIECGAPVKQGELTCLKCRQLSKPALVDNCAGAGVIVLAAVAVIVTLLLKGLA